jgi:DNA-binding NtrC family response regulator
MTKKNASSSEQAIAFSFASTTDQVDGKTVEPKPEPIHLLVVDDDEITSEQLENMYMRAGYRVSVANCAEEALPPLGNLDVDLVVVDLWLPGMTGIELVKYIRTNFADVPVLVVSAYGGIDAAINVLKLGACDYFTKPFSLAAILNSTRAALQESQLSTDIRHLRLSLKEFNRFGGLVSRTPAMHKVFEIIELTAGTDITVVVEGETGTGKELVASAIHHRSPRSRGPFIALNCAGFPEGLLESELFGYEKGAFTGADYARAGKIEMANGGTLFLDEIESISLNMQAKLLRVLETRTVRRLGGMQSSVVDIRVIAATNVPLERLLAQGKMRSDFYYRINVVSIRLVPLRERREDIPLLVNDFLLRNRVANQREIKGVSRRMLGRLMRYHWPGNVRELQNVLEKAVVLARGRIIEKLDLPSTEFSIPVFKPQDEEPSNRTLKEWLMEQEKQYIIQQLKSYGGRIGLTARNCGMGSRTLTRKLRFYGLDAKEFQHKTAPCLAPYFISGHDEFVGPRAHKFIIP